MTNNSRISVNAADDYLFFAQAYAENNGVSRVRPWVRLRKNGGSELPYAMGMGYGRNSEGSVNAGVWVGTIAEDLVANDYFEATHTRGATNAGAFNSDQLYFWGLRIGSLTGNWYESPWPYRKTITIDSSQVPSDQTNFPVLISFADSHIGANARADGFDLLFTDTDGVTKLDHEIETYTTADGTIVAWVRVPLLTSATDKVIHLYYGNSGASDQQNAAGVWDSDYVGVWHLKEDPGPGSPGDIKDSTSNAFHGTAIDPMTSGDQGPGQINGSIDFTATGDEIIGPTNAALDLIATDFTISAWALNPVSSWKTIVSNGQGDTNGWSLRTSSTGQIELVLGNGSSGTYTTGTTTAPAGWVHMTATFVDSTNTVSFFLNGAADGTDTFTSTLTASDYLAIGRRPTGGNSYDNWLDEIRISKRARSTDWVQIEYNNQSNPGIGGFLLGVGDSETEDSWYGQDWQRRKKITIDSTQVTADQTNFPVLISFTDGQVGASSRADGFDLLFTDTDGVTKLDHEIETFTTPAGTLVAWVRIPLLTSSVDKVIYLYYGNTGASDQQNAPGVWDTSYVSVWHLKEDPAGGAPQAKDSTTSAKHGTSAGGMTSGDQIPGAINGSLDFDADDRIDVGNHPEFDLPVYSWSMWVKGTVAPDSSGPNEHVLWNGDYNFSFAWGHSAAFMQAATHKDSGAWQAAQIATTLVADTWYYITGTYDSANIRVYLNGGLEDTQAAGTPVATTDVLMIGYADIAAFAGQIDEVRVSDIARSASWIQTSYNNQSAPGGFGSVGNEVYPSQGFNDPTADAPRAGTAPPTPSTAYTSDGTHAELRDATQHDYETYNFCIPGGATIQGLEVRTEWHTTKLTDTGYLTLQLLDSAGALVGTSKTTPTIDGTIDVIHTLGGTTDTWGAALTDTIVSTSNFGVSLLYTKTAGGGGNNAYVDNVDIKVSYTGGSGPCAAAGHWDLDEGSGDTAADSTANANDGTLGTAPGADASDPSWMCLVSGSALDFDGADDVLEVPDDPALVPSGDMTVAAWVKLDTLPSVTGEDAQFVHKRHSVAPWYSYELQVETASDKPKFLWRNSGGTNAVELGSGALSIDTWYHIAGVVEGTAVRLYVDGADVGTLSPTTSGTILDSDDDLSIGAAFSGGGRLDGAVDDVRIYDRALTTAQINALATSPPVDCAPAPDLQQIHYRWRNDDGGETGAACVAGPTTYATATSAAAYLVPTGCDTLTVKAWGAGGAGGGKASGGSGGGGGFAQADISVTPSESLTVTLGGGGAGGTGQLGTPAAGIGGGTTTPTAGGGAGGGGTTDGSNGGGGTTDGSNGGGGGGYAAVLRGGTFLIQAGGGGGGGGVGDGGSPAGGAGGAGGGTSGVAGSRVGSGGFGGGGGTTSAGGAGGSTGGASGSANTGGVGAVKIADSGSGGGGGSGRFGGGGGGAATDLSGGGGGGGSGLVTGTNTTLTAGSGTTPGNTADADYAASAGVGGAAGTNGNPGRIVLIPSSSGGSGATFAIAEDTALTGLPKNTTKRLRFEISNEGAVSSGSVPYQLEYSTITSGPWTVVPDSATTEHFETAASANITDGEATSDISPGLTNENTTFVAGELRDTLSATAGITLADTEFTELEYSIQATNAATSSGTYYFRLTNAGSSTNFSYPVFGEVTLGGGTTVLSGTTTLGSGVTTQNVTIPAVDLSRSVLFFNVRGPNNQPQRGMVRGNLTSSTNIQFNRNTSDSTVITIQWYVAEFESGVSVQRASGVDENAASNFAIGAVDLAKSFQLTSCTSAATTVYSEDDFPRSRLTTSTNLEILSTDTPNAGSLCDYQVVEHNDTSVQRGSGTLGSAAASTGAIAISAVDPTKSFVQVTWTVDGYGAGQNSLRARLTSATTIEIDREATGNNLDYAWEVVEFTDATTVQSGNLSLSTLETSDTATLTSVDTGRSVAFLSGNHRGAGHSYTTTDDGMGSGWFTTGITDSTTLTVEREVTNSVGAEAAWFVLEFPAPAPFSTRFRSVGTDATDLNTSSRTVTIAGTTATFSASMPDKVGVGDVLQYQVAATWYAAFISARTSNTVYTVQSATGGTPQAAAGGTAVSVYRAYTSQYNWEALDENDALNDAVEDFDTSTDLVAANAVMQVAAYADGPDTDSGQVHIGSEWVTGPNNYIRIYTPVSTSEVGVSQRHTGTAGTGYVRRPSVAGPGSYDVLQIDTNYVRVEGIDFDGSALTGAENLYGIRIQAASGSTDIRVEHCLIHDLSNSNATPASARYVRAIYSLSGNSTDLVKIANTAIYGISNINTNSGSGTNGISLKHDGGASYLYNNTVFDISSPANTASGHGMRLGGGATHYVKNNYVGQLSCVTCTYTPKAFKQGETATINADNNVSFDDSADDFTGANNVINQATYASYFANVSAGSEDFHLLLDSNALWGVYGADLDGDPNLPVTIDIDGQARDNAQPDVGVDEALAGGAPSASVGGTFPSSNTESYIVAGGTTLVLTLTNDTWDATIGANNAATTALINGLDSDGVEAAGWDAVVKANLTFTNVARTSDTVVTITLPAQAGYDITAAETITATVPAVAVAGGAPLVASPTFNVQVVSATITGTITSSANESHITTGGRTLVITLTNETWVATGAPFDGQRQAIINGMDSAQAEATGWDAVVKAGLAVTDVARTSDTVVTMTLPAFGSYDISGAETITATVPATAVTAGAAIVGSPTFIIATTNPSGQQEFVDDGVFTVPGGVTQFTIKSWGGGGAADPRTPGPAVTGVAAATSSTWSRAYPEATPSASPSGAAARVETAAATWVGLAAMRAETAPSVVRVAMARGPEPVAPVATATPPSMAATASGAVAAAAVTPCTEAERAVRRSSPTTSSRPRLSSPAAVGPAAPRGARSGVAMAAPGAPSTEATGPATGRAEEAAAPVSARRRRTALVEAQATQPSPQAPVRAGWGTAPSARTRTRPTAR